VVNNNMSMIVRIQINSREILCYSVRRITNVDVEKPHGKVSDYEIKECYSGKIMGNVAHKYDDPPEELVLKSMKVIMNTKAVSKNV